ncbi:MAG: carboxypeptidase regulatory-like domain-containing protein [Phycisphaerales bacterium]|nr:carboxypeptidase regulatory-like domain-containing protein [Phycisphaerales bacterium]
MKPSTAVALAVTVLTTVATWWFVRTTDDPSSPSPAPASEAHASLSPSHSSPTLYTAVADLPASTSDGIDVTRTRVATGHVVRGTLRQHEAPLANVPLRVFAGSDQKVAPVGATTSAADGSFAFVMPLARFCFVVDAPTIPRDWWSGWHSSRASDWDLGVVPVPNGGAVAGVVRDSLGQPVANAAVTAACGQYERRPAASDPPEPTPLRTDAAGTFRFEGLRPGGYRLTAVTRDHALAEANTTIVENGTAIAELEVQRGRRVQGIVLDWRGQPLPGAEVTVESMPEPVTTDARGVFVLENHLDHKSLHVSAAGHIADWHQVPYGADEPRIRLGRAVTLRGAVRGAGSAATTILLSAAKDRAPDAADPRPWDLVDKPLPVAADGTFVIEGLSTADFLVRADAAGLGASSPLRVALREDTAIELTIAPRNAVRVVVQDPEGRAIDGAEIVEDPGIADFPTLYSGPYAKGVSERIFGRYTKRCTIATAGVAVLPVESASPLAFGVRCEGFLPEVRVFANGDVPPELEVVFQRAGGVRGIVHGGSSTEYARSVTLWAVADDAEVAALRQPSDVWRDWRPLSIPVDAVGRFVATGLAPGPWRAELSRANRADVGLRSDQLVGVVPLLDDGAIDEGRIGFTIIAGTETSIELGDPPLATLRGRVLLHGAPCADAIVLAVRPGWRPRALIRRAKAVDWEEDSVRSQVAGQRVAADGTFVFRYRHGGPVELRVRHTKGAATSLPTVVELPPPGTGSATCTLHLDAGAIRGRFAIEQLRPMPASLRKAVLYPLSKASDDPSWSTDWVVPTSWTCAQTELPMDGRFSFDNLADGDWLVRVQEHALGSDPGPLWQRVVHIAGGVVDLGEIAATARVTTKLTWKWPEGAAPGAVLGVWLRVAHADDPAAIWAGTFVVETNGATCSVPAGIYTVVPFGFVDAGLGWQSGHGLGGITGDPLAKPFPIEVHADGTVTPVELVFVPLPPPPPKQR